MTTNEQNSATSQPGASPVERKVRAPRAVWLAQRFWRRWVQVPYWCMVCMWMMVTGRYFWFKSAPDWFVRLYASMPDDGSGSEVQDFLDAAHDEARLRRKQRYPGRPNALLNARP